jgi:hypothetical protein
MNFKTFEYVAISVFSKNKLLKTTYSTDILSLICFLNRYSDDVLIIIINEKDNNLLYDGNVLMFKKLIRDKLFE